MSLLQSLAKKRTGVVNGLNQSLKASLWRILLQFAEWVTFAAEFWESWCDQYTMLCNTHPRSILFRDGSVINLGLLTKCKENTFGPTPRQNIKIHVDAFLPCSNTLELNKSPVLWIHQKVWLFTNFADYRFSVYFVPMSRLVRLKWGLQWEISFLRLTWYYLLSKPPPVDFETQ